MADIFSCPSCGFEQKYNAVLHKYDKVVKECEELRQSLAKVQNQRDEYIKEINQAITARLKATQELSRVTEERNSAIHEYNLIMSERDTVHKEIEKLQEELIENQKKLTTLQEEKIVNLEQIDSLKREVTSVLIDRDRLLKKIQEDRVRYGKFDEDPMSPLRSPSSSANSSSMNNSHNQWDISFSGLSSSWKQTSRASIGSHGQSQLGSSRLDSMEHVNVEIELLRRQNENLQQDLMYSHNEIEMHKKELNIALEFKEKVSLERESMRTLCDRLRKERDRVVCDLAEALRESDEMRRQLGDAQKELNKLKDKLENDKACEYIYKEQSCSSISSTLSSPNRANDKQKSQTPTSPTPTILDSAYNKIYGDKRLRKTVENSAEQDARETLESLDKVLANCSNQINVAKKALENSKREKEKNGGTWPKYKGPRILKISEDEKLNEGATMRSINRKGRKSLAVFNPIIKVNNDIDHNPSGKNNLSLGNEQRSGSTLSPNCSDPNSYYIYDSVNKTPIPISSSINDYHSQSPRSTPSNSSTPVSVSNVITASEKVSATDLHPEGGFFCIDNYLSPSESAHYRSLGKADSIDYSVVSAQIQSYQDRKIGDSYCQASNSSTKMRPHSIHDVLSTTCSRISSSVVPGTQSLSPNSDRNQQQKSQGQQQHQQRYHHQQQSSHDSYVLPINNKITLPNPPVRASGESIGLFRVAQPLDKRKISNHAHSSSISVPSSSHPHSPNSLSSLTRPPHSSSSLSSTTSQSVTHRSPHSPIIYNPHLSRTSDSGISMREKNHLYDLPTSTNSSGITSSTSVNSNSVDDNNKGHHYSKSNIRPISLYHPSIAKLAVKDGQVDNNRYINTSPTFFLDSDHSGLINVPMTSSSSSSQHHHYYPASLHVPQSSTDTGMGYKSDENESDPIFSYEGSSTLSKRSGRIHSPFNPSVTSTCSSSKLSTGSIDKVTSSTHFDRGSPLSFSVEWLSSGRRYRNSNNLKPRPGDIRHIGIMRSSGTLGINISSGPAGVFVTTVEKDSLAHQAGIQVGDQILEICGINMRNAVYDHAANILRQCGERLNLLVQYNPNKLVANRQSS